VRLIILSFKYSSLKAGLAKGLVRILVIISIIGMYLSLISLVLISNKIVSNINILSFLRKLYIYS